MYHFSRVEGHALDFGVFVDDAFNRRFNSSLKLSYGFSDKNLNRTLVPDICWEITEPGKLNSELLIN